MDLRPRRVDFEEVWSSLKDTVQRIVKIQEIKRTTWDSNFR